LIIAIIEHSKTKSKQKISRDPSIRKFGSARKIGYSEPERSRRLRKNRFRYKKHVRLQGSAMAAAALPAKEAKGEINESIDLAWVLSHGCDYRHVGLGGRCADRRPTRPERSPGSAARESRLE
jgi:hypothetical protein